MKKLLLFVVLGLILSSCTVTLRPSSLHENYSYRPWYKSYYGSYYEPRYYGFYHPHYRHH